LNLRNLVDRYGAQEYFDTLKLQFGFTCRGAARRLPDWLDGLGIPIAVKILTGTETEFGDLASESFISLWKTLRDFRRGGLSEEYASAVFRASPWVRPEWRSDLFKAAKLRSERSIPPSAPITISDGAAEAICEPRLRWPNNGSPQFVLQLNEERIIEMLGESSVATFTIDGRLVGRWIGQEDGGWRGSRELPCQPEGAVPNLRPKLLTISVDRKVIEDVDLVEIGLAEPLLIFELNSGARIPRFSRLHPERNYAFVCDRDFKVSSAAPSRILKDRCAFRVTAPWPRDLKVLCDGLTYWEPSISEREPVKTIHLTLESATRDIVEIGSAVRIRVVGAPDDATAITLIVGNSSFSTIRQNGEWQTEQPVPVTVRVALGEERIRVRLAGCNYARMVTPQSALHLRGLAFVESDSESNAEPQWKLLARGRPLDRVDGSGRARVFADGMRCTLYEGVALIGKVSSRGLPLRDLLGWGAKLIASLESLPEMVLVDSVEDHGLARFVPPLLGRPTGTWINWRTPTPLSREHQILLWTDLFEPPQRFGINGVVTQHDDLVWRLPSCGAVSAMAVTYQGARLASYWSPDAIIRALRRGGSGKLFSLLRWLKAPVLNSSLRPPIQEAVSRAPADFIEAWLANGGLPAGLIHRPAEQGLETVVREFLWNYRETNEHQIDRIAAISSKGSVGSSPSHGEVFKTSLLQLSALCPSLAWTFAKCKLRGDQYRKHVQAVAAAVLGQSGAPDLQQLQQRLTFASRDAAVLMGISPASLIASVGAFAAYLDRKALIDGEQERHLTRLGETLRGRQFLSASLLARLVERSRF
jgi:hypothetical protein